jgi:hypothetical protein
MAVRMEISQLQPGQNYRAVSRFDRAAREWEAFSPPQRRFVGLLVALGFSGVLWLGMITALVHLLRRRSL